MTKKIMAAVAALAIAGSAIVGGAATAEAKVRPVAYNPTYCVLFLPFLCMPPTAAPAHHHHKVIHKAAMKAKPAKKM